MMKKVIDIVFMILTAVGFFLALIAILDVLTIHSIIWGVFAGIYIIITGLYVIRLKKQRR